jgi:hypothetical protein
MIPEFRGLKAHPMEEDFSADLMSCPMFFFMPNMNPSIGKPMITMWRTFEEFGPMHFFSEVDTLPLLVPEGVQILLFCIMSCMTEKIPTMLNLM